MIRFYVGEITGTTPQTVKIYTDLNTSVDIEVSEGNKWYSYVLPKDNRLYQIEGDSVKKVVVKADISFEGNSPLPITVKHIIPSSTVEASFKSSNTSNITSMFAMFSYCSGLTSLDLSGWDTSKVNDMTNMFSDCSDLTSLDLSGWNTSNVTDMGFMFYGCSGLTSLDLSGWDTSNVTHMNFMFSGCSKLTTIRMVGCSTATIKKITDVKPSSATIVTE